MNSTLDWNTSALVIVDPQIDVLSPEGAAWDLVGEQVTRLGIIDKLVALRDEAERAGAPILYSWLSVTDEDYRSWTPQSGLQQLMAERKMVRPDHGGRFHPRLAPTERTVLLSPRKGPSPAHSDLTLQLKRRGIETIVLAGMIANLCVEAHVRDAGEAGFGTIVVRDAIATTDDASLAATLGNFGLLANGLLDTHEVIASLQGIAA